MPVSSMLAVALVVPMLALPVAVARKPAPPEDAWQSVVSGQIDAMRKHDAVKALSYTSTDFRKNFPDPTQFLIVIEQAGYGPIENASSYSFGPYEQVTTSQVLQSVRFVGHDHAIYAAIYQLDYEAVGWRVSAMQLIEADTIVV